MTLSPLRSKASHHHGRSLSLPSKLQHPSISEFHQNLSEISTSSSVVSMLCGLKALYRNIDDLLVFPHTQQIMISQQSHEQWVNNRVLDAYIRLLDACTTARDILSQTKQDVQQLLSALRRKDANGIQFYQTSRKCSRKTVQKALKELRSFKITKEDKLPLENDDEIPLAVVYMMIKEAESVTITMFENLLSYVITDKDVPAKQSSWSLASKLTIISKKISQQTEEMDSSHLKEMESSIRFLENELESLFRQLIKTRVSLLNILNP